MNYTVLYKKKIRKVLNIFKIHIKKNLKYKIMYMKLF